MLSAHLGHSLIPTKAVENRSLRGAVGKQNLNALTVSLAVMNLQRQTQLFSQGDMGAERLPLRHAPTRAGTEQIHTGLPHRHHSFGVFPAGPLHLGQGGVEIISAMVGLKTRLQTVRAHLVDARM